MAKYPQGQFSIAYGTQTISFELVHSDRDTVAIHVHPDTSVLVDAPVGSDYDQVAERVCKKAKWIVKQQRLYAQHQPTVNRIPHYTSGETHYYLGRQYRLKVIQDDVERVRFYRGRLYLHVHQPSNYDRKADLLNQWYRTRAGFIFSQQLHMCHPLVEPFGVPYPTFKIREMKSRWGSASPRGSITLNLRLIYIPKKLINYVILHELCHLKEMNHSSNFYDLLSRIMPSWEQFRDELNLLEYV